MRRDGRVKTFHKFFTNIVDQEEFTWHLVRHYGALLFEMSTIALLCNTSTRSGVVLVLLRAGSTLYAAWAHHILGRGRGGRLGLGVGFGIVDVMLCCVEGLIAWSILRLRGTRHSRQPEMYVVSMQALALLLGGFLVANILALVADMAIK